MHAVNVDRSSTVPHVSIPVAFNLAESLLRRNIDAGRAERIAYVDDAGRYTFGDLAERTNRFANALRRLGVRQEERVLLCMLDTIDFPAVFLGAIKAGVVPVAVNTLLTAGDYGYMLEDSRAVAIIASDVLTETLAQAASRATTLRHRIVAGASRDGWLSLGALLETASPVAELAATRRDEPAFWLYSSGSTGTPKGTVHIHSSAIEAAALYADGVLGLSADDRVFSAAKLFFAYGLGNSLFFPLWAGATALLMRERPTPGSVATRFASFAPTLFCGVPTLFASLLASDENLASASLRLCVSAGEALPPPLYHRWHSRTGVEILDGIGSTEMLHIFLSNRAGSVRPGTLGKPVPGYAVKICDDVGHEVAAGGTGDLYVSGPTAAMHYWGQRDKSRQTFQGPWTRTGDKFSVDADGNYVYEGRSDDMLKISGIYVSPIEVEATLAAHPAVLEAAVVGRPDESGLLKPLAFVVPAAGQVPDAALAESLQAHVKQHLAPYKYPRWIEFVADLPKTATGKLQRFKLRELARAAQRP